MLSSEDYKLIEEAARRDNMTVEEWAEATLIKDAQKRMKTVSYTHLIKKPPAFRTGGFFIC